jgi:hypothetical protein
MNIQQLLELLRRDLPAADAANLRIGTLHTEHRGISSDEIAALLADAAVTGWLTTAKGNWFRRTGGDWQAVNDKAELDLVAAIRNGRLLQGELILSEHRSLRIDRDGANLLAWFLDAGAGGDEAIWQRVTRLATIPTRGAAAPAMEYAVAWQPQPRTHGDLTVQPLLPAAARLVAWKEA